MEVVAAVAFVPASRLGSRSLRGNVRALPFAIRGVSRLKQRSAGDAEDQKDRDNVSHGNCSAQCDREL
jgi:hypothetical protein